MISFYTFEVPLQEICFIKFISEKRKSIKIKFCFYRQKTAIKLKVNIKRIFCFFRVRYD